MNFSDKKISAALTISGRMISINADPDDRQMYIDADIDQLGMGSGKARVKIYGLSESTIRQCTIIFPQSAVLIGNRLQLLVNGSPLFNGEIYRSVPNYANVPNISLDIECWLDHNGISNRVKSSQQVVYPSESEPFESKTIHEALRFISQQICGYGAKDVFEDEKSAGNEYSMDGTSCLYRRTAEKLPYRLYLVGTPKEMLDGFCHNFGIQYAIRVNGDKKQELWYWPVGKLVPATLRDNSRFWAISAEKGNLFGYPEATESGVKFLCEFNGKMQVGDGVSLITQVPGLSGNYAINQCKGRLSTKDGKWEASVEAVRYAESKPE